MIPDDLLPNEAPQPEPDPLTPAPLPGEPLPAVPAPTDGLAAPEEDDEDEGEEVEDDEDEDDDLFDETEEELAEYAEFARLDPEFDHRRLIIRASLKRRSEQRARRRKKLPATDWTKTQAERDLAQTQQRAAWEVEGREWFTRQHAAGVFDDWLAQFAVTSIDSLESFAKSYATAYANYRAYGASFASWLDGQKLQYREKAARLLWQIQQKKLLDLQCHWRAGQVTVPGLDVAEEFEYWNDRLHRCPFLPAITDDEFALYLAYADSADFDEEADCDQDYARYKKEQIDDEDGVTMPEWYQFHNARTGHGALLLLPDVRGEREEHYQQTYFRYCRERQAAAEPAPTPEPPAAPAPADPRPVLRWYNWRGADSQPDRYAHDFLRRFADPGVLQHMKAVDSTRLEDRDELTEAFELLMEVRETVPMAAHPNWREAVKLTAARYSREQTRLALTAAYEDYKLREQLGLAHAAYSDVPDYRRAMLLVEKLDILKGRILCGEPATFDY